MPNISNHASIAFRGENNPAFKSKALKTSTPTFGSGFVTLSVRNLGRQISDEIVDVFNKGVLQDLAKTTHKSAKKVIKSAQNELVKEARLQALGAKPKGILKKAIYFAKSIAFNLTNKSKITKELPIRKPEDLVNKVNFFALAAGSGSRFKELAETVGNYNKISIPFFIKDDKKFKMLDIPMAMGKFFVDKKKGYESIIAETKSGSLGDIVKKYLAGDEIKDTIVCCGDNVFGTKAEELTSFFTKVINDKNTHLALVGVERTPEEVAKRFGVLKPATTKAGKDIMQLAGFEEKPALEVAKQLATEDGKCYANTGMFYISKEAMKNLIDEIKSGVNNIKKADDEPYDFALATKYIHSKMKDWFGIAPEKGAVIKTVKQWEDVGEPKAYYQFLKDVKNGTYLENFPKKYANEIKDAVARKTSLDGVNDAILYSNKYNSIKDVPQEVIAKAPVIDGVKIVTE